MILTVPLAKTATVRTPIDRMWVRLVPAAESRCQHFVAPSSPVHHIRRPIIRKCHATHPGGATIRIITELMVNVMRICIEKTDVSISQGRSDAPLENLTKQKTHSSHRN